MASNLVPDAQHTDLHAHPSQRTYVQIAIFLGIITAVEVAIYYIEALDNVLVPLLVALSFVKFVTVVGYFMHLRFDTRFLAFVFGAALIVSLAVYLGTWLMMDYGAVEQFTGDMSV